MSTTESTRNKSAKKQARAKPAVGKAAVPRAPSAVSRAGGSILNAIMRRLDVSSIGVNSIDAASINVGRIELDNASVGQVELTNLNASVSTESARLINVRSVVALRLTLSWRIPLPWPFSDIAGSVSIEVPIPFKLGNVDVNDIDTINIEVPNASVSGAQVTIQPITDFQFNGGSADDINLSTLQMPSNGFAMSGLSYDTFDLSHLGLPDGKISNASIGELSPNGILTIPETVVSNVQIPEVDVPSVNSTSPVNVENVDSDVIPPLNFLFFTLRLTPTMDLNIERLELSNMQASSSIDSISLNNMTTSVKVKDVSVSDIDLEQLTINQVSL